MRVQSIVSAFIIVLGNGVLHLQLTMLSENISVPKQEDIEALTRDI